MRFLAPARASSASIAALLLTGLLGACSKPEGAPPVADAAMAAPADAAPAAVSPARAAEDAARALTRRWNDAIDAHDLDALAAIYGDRVVFYGKDSSRSAVLAAKKHAFAAAPTFRQSIVGDLTVKGDARSFTVFMNKRSGGKTAHDVKARVVISGGHVVEESDIVTDDRASARQINGCGAIAAFTVRTLPPVKKMLDDVQKELAKSKDGSTLGGMSGGEEGTDLVNEGIGVHHPDRYEAQVWYRVDAGGTLTVELLGQDVAIPAAAAQNVAKACTQH